MNATFSRMTRTLARAAAAFAAALTLASCGGGGVSPSPNVPDQGLIVVLPSSSVAAPVVVYSGLPTTFSVTGGNGSYIVASNNQAVIASPGSVVGSSFTIVPLPVIVDTTVTLSIRDTAEAPAVTAVVTVRPGTINNNITITPSSTQDASCEPAICSGGDAEVKVTLSQGGIPLPARGVRFDVVSGNFNFITSVPGQPELVAATRTVTTDETGIARTRLRVTAGAPNQTALLQVTDLGTGAHRQASFVIAQYNGNDPAFFTLPAAITLTGPNNSTCSNGALDVAVFGGTPPYTIVGSSTAFSVTPTFIAASGGKFTVSFLSTARCVENLPVAVTDASGRTLTVSVTNQLGTTAPAITLSPTQITGLGCGQSASMVIIGGTEPFSASSSDGLLLVIPPAVRTVTMNAITSGAFPTYGVRTATVTVTDGATSASAPVSFSCP